jgi:hypothetical protein
MKLKALLLTLLIPTMATANTIISSPVEGGFIIGNTFTIYASNDAPLPSRAEWVVFRSAEGWWPAVHRVRPSNMDV